MRHTVLKLVEIYSSPKIKVDLLPSTKPHPPIYLVLRFNAEHVWSGSVTLNKAASNDPHLILSTMDFVFSFTKFTRKRLKGRENLREEINWKCKVYGSPTGNRTWAFHVTGEDPHRLSVGRSFAGLDRYTKTL